jgi:hypothetical protein
MSLKSRVAALESRSPQAMPRVSWIDYRTGKDGTVLAATVNGTITVERLPGESMDDLDARALVAAQVTGQRIIKVSWVSPHHAAFEE